MSRFCVIAGTKISLTNGNSLPIEQIKAGEEVLSFDLNTLQRSQKYDILVKLKTNDFSGIIKKDYVKNIWKNTADEYFAINDKLKITGDHIVLAKRDNTYYWTKVFNLKIGDYLFTEFNVFEKIETMILIREKVKVFNLEVNSIYNYFANSYLIHNGAPCSACGSCGRSWRFEESLYAMANASALRPVLISNDYAGTGGNITTAFSGNTSTHSDSRGLPNTATNGNTNYVGFWVEPDRELVTYNLTINWNNSYSNKNADTPGMNTIYLTNKPPHIVPNVTFDSSNNMESTSILPGFSHTESTIVGFGLDEFWLNGNNTSESNGGISGLPIRKRVQIGLKNAYSYMNHNGDQMCTFYDTTDTNDPFKRKNSDSTSGGFHDGAGSLVWLQLTGFSTFPSDLTGNNVVGHPNSSTDSSYTQGGRSTGGNVQHPGFNLSGYLNPNVDINNAAGIDGNAIIGNGQASGMDLIFEVTYSSTDDHQKLRVLLHKRSDGADGITATNGYVNIFTGDTNCTLGNIYADIATDAADNTNKQRHYVLPKYYSPPSGTVSSANPNILNENWTFFVRDSTGDDNNSFTISIKNYTDLY